MMQVTGMGRSSGKVKVLILLAVAMLLGGGVSFFVFGRAKAPEKSDEKGKHGKDKEGKGKEGEDDEEAEPAEFIDMGSFVVNLAGDGDLRYLKVSVTLAVHKVPVEGEEEGKKGKEEGGGHGGGAAKAPTLPPADDGKARDVIVRVLSDQRFEDVRQGPQREKIKALIVAELNKTLKEYEAAEVLFTSFVMQ